MRRFDVHHLDHNKEGKHHALPISYDRENMDKLITYCHKCHLSLDHIIEKFKIVNNRGEEFRERNDEIRKKYLTGMVLRELAEEYSVTYQRIQQIVRKKEL